jgi:hypothetical protein
MLTSVAWILLPAQARGCDCVNSGPPCKAFAATSEVFAGRVVKILATETEYRKVSFEVTATYRGSAGKTAEILTGSGGGDCGFDFREGKDYLVYAGPQQESGKLYTSICTRTRLLSEARDDLDYFTKKDDPALGAGIEGDIFQLSRDARNNTQVTGPMAGITITVSGVAGKRTVVSRKDGHFQIWGLVPGAYRVSPILPDTFLKTALTVRLGAQGCEEVRFLATPPPIKQ